MANEPTTEPTLEEDFKNRAIDYIETNPVQAAPLNMLLQHSGKKRLFKLSLELRQIREEIEDEKSVDAPKPKSFWTKVGFIGKKILLFGVGISIIVGTAYVINSTMNNRVPKHEDAKQEIPANHVNDKGAE